MLNLGREERVKRVQRFMDIYPLIKTHLEQQAKQHKKQKNNSEKELKQAVDYIDLRYDTGLAVGWKSVANLPLSMKLTYKEKTSHEFMLLTKEFSFNV